MKKIILLLTILFFSIHSFGQSRYISKSTKQIVFTRDVGICQCCGSALNLEYDHIKPFSCGGDSKVSNIQLLCRKCNRSKSNSCYCKVHNKKVGNDCCKGRAAKKSTNYKQSSKSVTRQCTGTTKKGRRCKNRTKNSNGRCHYH
jgi:hypothetical protein|tara:strand:- start:298 stop:729 length:432 start_codon:yes stop_codon:yes gene_type:complete